MTASDPITDRYAVKADAATVVETYRQRYGQLDHQHLILQLAFQAKCDELALVTQQRDSAMMQLASKEQQQKKKEEAGS